MLTSPLRPAREQPGGDAVDEDADRRDRHDGEAGNGLGRDQPLHRLHRDRPAGDEQQHGIGERGEDARALQAIGEARAGRALRQMQAAPGQRQAGDIGQIVAGVRQQRHRAGPQAEPGLGGDIGEVETNADGERRAEIMAAPCSW